MKKLFGGSKKARDDAQTQRRQLDPVDESLYARREDSDQFQQRRSPIPPEQQQGPREDVEHPKHRTGGMMRMLRRNSAREPIGQPAPEAGVRRSHTMTSRTQSGEGRQAPRPAITPDQITRQIGWLCGTGSDDWQQIMRLCDECAQSEVLAKEAVRSLRKEIEHGQPEPQMRAARLLVIISRNSSDRFRLKVVDKRFLDVYAKAVESKKTRVDVRAFLLKALSILAFEYKSDYDLSALTSLYNRLKHVDDPIDGAPIDENDPTFEPTVAPRRSRRPAVDLWAECELAQSNAQMLHEALAFTKPDDIATNAVIPEFYAASQRSQHILVDAIPGATQAAEQARSQAVTAGNPDATTQEDQLLSRLLAANQDLIDVFKMWDDLERQRRTLQEEREATARSLADQRGDRHGANLAVDSQNGASSSRSPSPLPNGAPATPPARTRPLSLNPYAAAMTPPQSVSPPPSQPRYQPPRQVEPVQSYPTYAPSQQPAVDSPSKNPYAAVMRSSQTSSSPSRLGTIPQQQIAQSYTSEPEELVFVPTLASQNPYRSKLSGSSSLSPQRHGSTRSEDDDTLVTPIEPSEKALGKLRRLSTRGDDGPDYTEEQAKLEAALRERYALNRRESDTRKAEARRSPPQSRSDQLLEL